MTFEGWTVADFPISPFSFAGAPNACVYVFFLVRHDREVPFYVGESKRFPARICNDYRLKTRKGSPLKKFGAPTDFCLAEALAYLSGKGLRVTVRFKASSGEDSERKKEERMIIDDLLLDGQRLLNCLGRFDHKKADEEKERSKIRKFCDMLCRVSFPD